MDSEYTGVNVYRSLLVAKNALVKAHDIIRDNGTKLSHEKEQLVSVEILNMMYKIEGLIHLTNEI